MSGQACRFFVAFTPWRLAVLLMASIFVTGCSDSGDGGSGDPAPPLPSEIRRISVDSSGGEANGASAFAKLSETGRYVVYQSVADNLVADDTNLVRDAFLHDVLTGKTSRVSVDSDGVQGDDESSLATLSADGRYVVFRSIATNLVDNDTNNKEEIFLHDTLTGKTQRVSVDSAGAEADGDSSSPAINATGQFVVFESQATNLVPDDTNAAADIFLRDLQNGTTSRISLDSQGAEADAQSLAAHSTISADGRYIVFRSDASNLIFDDNNNARDIFVRDTVNNTTEIVSVHTDGTQATRGSGNQSISNNGRYVVFITFDAALVADDTNGIGDIFVRDIVDGITTRVSLSSAGEEGNNVSGSASISGDGRYVAFASLASNLVTNDTNAMEDIFVKDRQTNDVVRVSVSATGVEGDNNSDRPVISTDGRYIVFHSDATNLVDNDTNGVSDTFITPNPLVN